MGLAPEYWTIDGSRDPGKMVPLNTGDVALKEAGAAKDSAEFMQKGGFWINKKPYENYKTLREIGYGRPNGRVRMYIDEFLKVNHEPLPMWLHDGMKQRETINSHSSLRWHHGICMQIQISSIILS